MDYGKTGSYCRGIYAAKSTLTDEFPVNIYLLPFIKPAFKDPFSGNLQETYHQQVRIVIEEARYPEERNVLIAHHLWLGGHRATTI